MAQKINILVTGANGFIGRHLCAGLAYNLDFKCHITAIDPEQTREKIHIPIYDIFQTTDTGSFMKTLNDSYELKNLFPEKQKFDFIIHLGSISRSKIYEQYPEDSISSDTLALLSLLSYCKNHKNTKLIYASSSHAKYNEIITPFATSKKIAENLIYTYVAQYGINATIARIHNVYGPGEADYAKFNSLIKSCKLACIDDGTISLSGSGDQVRDWVHISTVIEGFLSIINAKLQSDNLSKSNLNFNKLSIYEIGSTVGVKVNDVIKAFGIAEDRIIRSSINSSSVTNRVASLEFLPLSLKKQIEYGIQPISIIEYIQAWISDGMPLD